MKSAISSPRDTIGTKQLRSLGMDA